METEAGTGWCLISQIAHSSIIIIYNTIDIYLGYNYNIIMKEIRFEWDENKAISNFQKHGISFVEAATVFSDINAVLFDDPDHSEDEERFILLGLSTKANLLIVCHCLRASESIIRIISARKATKTESEDYFEISNGW